MSDFFIGQLLVFAALIPVLLEPFIRSLRRVEGIPLLSVVACAVCLGTAASGIRILFFPLFAFALVILFSQAGRFVSMARRRESSPIPEEGAEARPGAKMLHALALAVLAALAALSAHFQPEFSYSTERETRAATEQAALSAGFRYRFNLFSAEEAASEPASSRAVLIYFPSFPAGRSGRDTLLAMAAERGFDAFAVQWSGKNLYFSASMNPQILRDLRQIIHSIGQSFRQAGTEAQYITRFEQAQGGVMQTVILDAARFALERLARENPEGTARLFAVAEGYACASLAAVAEANPDLFAGAVYLLSEDRASYFREPGTEWHYQRGLQQAIPQSAAELAGIVMTGGMAGDFGFGEMTAEDPALAALMGLERDKRRRFARLAAERVLAWIEMRSGRLDSPESGNSRAAAGQGAAEAPPTAGDEYHEYYWRMP